MDEPKVPPYLWLLLITAVILGLISCIKRIPESLPGYSEGPGWSYYSPEPGIYIVLTDDRLISEPDTLEQVMQERLGCGPCTFAWGGSSWIVEVLE